MESDAYFWMEGGEISGNKFEDDGELGALPAGAVSIGESGHLMMTGGKISGNTGGLGDVIVASNAASFNLAGAAEIGSLTLERNLAGTERASVTLTGAFTGKVDALNLYVAKASDQTVVENWANQVVLKESGYIFTSSDVAKFTLGEFLLDNSDAISINMRIQETGTNKGKLVVK
jgi:hypothetical protein